MPGGQLCTGRTCVNCSASAEHIELGSSIVVMATAREKGGSGKNRRDLAKAGCAAEYLPK